MKSSESQSALIFICYRRADVGGYSKLVFKSLNEVFKDKVFRDLGSIEAGDDFAETLRRELASCVVLIALIGGAWLDIRDAAGKRRLDDPEDFVRQEIATALRRGIKVIPVLIGEARMPPPDELPDEMWGLSRRQALRVIDEDWERGMECLTDLVKKEIAKVYGGGGNFRDGLRRGWGRVRGLVWNRFTKPVLAALVVVLTLVVPVALIIGRLTYEVASRYQRLRSLVSILDDPVVYGQLAAYQALCVLAYSWLWVTVYKRLRRRSSTPEAGGDDEPQDTPRKEQDTPRNEIGGRV